MSKVDMMVDIETLGTRAGCVVLSIGAAVFDSESGNVVDSLHLTLQRDAQGAKHMFEDKETLAWWDTQPRAAWLAATQGAVPPSTALFKLDRLVSRRPPARVYCQGQDFDFPILAELARRFDRTLPWKHWQQRDTRTVYDEHGFDAKALVREGEHHNALDDCRHQIKCLMAARGVVL